MAATDSSPNHIVGIGYGFLEGPLHARLFRKQLTKHGLRYSGNHAECDILLAHSAGCWYLSQELSPKLTVYVGMPLAKQRTRRTLWQSNLQDVIHLSWRHLAVVGVKNIYYALLHPRRNWRIMQQADAAEPTMFSSSQHIFIANQHDPWPRGNALEHYLEHHDWAFISLPGSHNNLWEDPEQYIAILEHYAELLA